MEGRVMLGLEVARGVDMALARPVLVIGSSPPAGRDLDLLGRRPEHDAACAWLDGHGFVRRRSHWARFDAMPPPSVELFCVDRWFASSSETDVLFSHTERVDGFEHLVAPGPPGVLLLAARALVVRRGRLTDKSRDRVAGALERWPDAWSVAEQQAPGLGLLGAVRLLRRSYEAPGGLSAPARSVALVGQLASPGSLRAKTKILSAVRRPRLRSATVSFSGLDGAGKSTQGARLAETLAHLGVRSTPVWGEFATAWRLFVVSDVMDRLAMRPPPDDWRMPLPERKDKWLPGGAAHGRVRRQAWVFTVASFNVAKQWRHVLRRRGASTLIFDRFTPDAAVKLDFYYPYQRHVDIAWQRAFFARLAPKPDIGFLLAVPAEVAHARVHEWSPDELREMARLYELKVRPFGLVRLDGTAPADDLARVIATTVWQKLP